MKRFSFCARALRWFLLGLTLVLCQRGRAVELAEATRQFEVLQVEKSRVEALIRDDFVALDGILSEDLLYVHSSGLVETKAEFLEALRSGRLKYKALEHEDEKVRLFKDTAILTGKTRVHSFANGEDIRLWLRFTMVYVQHAGRWRMATWQSARLPEDAAPVVYAGPPFPLWDETQPQPTVSTLRQVSGVDYTLVQAQTAEYRFLHETRLGFHAGELVVSFSNAPHLESEPAQILRSRRSQDGGRTWSAVTSLVDNPPNGERYETAPLLSVGPELFAFLGRYGIGGRESLGMEVRKFVPTTGRLDVAAVAVVMPGLIPTVQPQRLENGNWILAGHVEKVKAAAVAISKGTDFSRWRTIKIATPGNFFYPETTLLIKGGEVLAVSRNHKSDQRALVARSRDFGESFEPGIPSNLEMSDSKPFAGTLSTGQRYLIYNGLPNRRGDGRRNRNDLLIAVTQPGEAWPLRKAWILISGKPELVQSTLPREPGSADDQAWAYPEAVEHDGILYIVFSQNKRHCWMARLPVASLELK